MTRSAGLGVPRKAFLIVMVDGYDTLMLSFLAPSLARRWSLGPADLGSLFAAGYFGAVVGGLLMGTIADRRGRRPALVACLLLAAVATALCAAAERPDILGALRFIAGIGLGGAVPSVVALTAGAAPPERRGATVTTMYLGFPLGAVLGGGITAALLHLGAPTIFLATAAVCALAAMVAATMPSDESLASDPVRTRPFGVAKMQFADGRLAPALLLWAGLFCTLLLTYFLVSWTPMLIGASGGSPKTAAFGPVLLNLGGIVGAYVSSRVIDRYGPYLPNAVLMLLGALAVALLGRTLGNVPVALATLFMVGVLLLGPQLGFPAMAADLFPPQLRSTGAGWLSGIGRLGSIAGPVVGGWLIAHKLSVGDLLLAAAVPAGAGALALSAAHFLRPLGSLPAGARRSEQSAGERGSHQYRHR